MDKSEYDKLRQTIEQRRTKRVDAAEAEYRESISALETIWDIARESAGNSGPLSDSIAIAQRGGRETPTTLVRGAISQIHGGFSTISVREWIGVKSARDLTTKEISSVFHKMKERNEIRIVRESHDNEPATYERVNGS